MLDLKFVRDNQDLVKQAIKNKNSKVNLDEVLALDERYRKLLTELEAKRAEQNRQTNKGKPGPEVMEQLKQLKEALKLLEEEVKRTAVELEQLSSLIPNIPSTDTPIGTDEAGNKILRQWGRPTTFAFPAKEHWELGKALGVLDTEKAGAISGTRFGYILGGLAQLEFALIQFALAILTDEKALKKIIRTAKLTISPKPFIAVVPPVMIRPEVFQRMARLEPKEERYHIPSDDIYLVGSAEHTLGPLHMDEILEEKLLPIRYVGFSTAFRREAGSYGKDTKGILRVHQFDKVEMESFTVAEQAVAEQDFFVAIQEYLLQQLVLPYQVVQICTGDMGGPDARQIDLETWLPGQNRYRETHTADLMTDYQARRLNTRVRRGNHNEFVHMNDATVIAIGRTLIAIMENYQTEPGTIKIPKVLQKYLPGLKEIKRSV